MGPLKEINDKYWLQQKNLKRSIGFSRLFFLPYIALISMFASQMAMLGFIFFLSFISPGTSHLMVGVYSRAVREREVRKKKEERRRKRKEEKSPNKPLRRARESNPRTHEILLTSRVFYPLDHSATPSFRLLRIVSLMRSFY